VDSFKMWVGIEQLGMCCSKHIAQSYLQMYAITFDVNILKQDL